MVFSPQKDIAADASIFLSTRKTSQRSVADGHSVANEYAPGELLAFGRLGNALAEIALARDSQSS
jgi:hypothetical protein